MQIDLGYGHVFAGTPMEIITQMKSIATGVDELDLGEYIDWVVERAASVEGVLLFVRSGPLHSRAESLLREMIDSGLARDPEEVDELTEERVTARWIAAREIAALQP
jgi:hypothetical protein